MKISLLLAERPVTETITTTWIIMAVLIIGSIILTRNLDRIPKGMQNVVELLVGLVYGLTEDTMGKDKVGFAPYIGTLMQRVYEPRWTSWSQAANSRS